VYVHSSKEEAADALKLIIDSFLREFFKCLHCVGYDNLARKHLLLDHRQVLTYELYKTMDDYLLANVDDALLV